MPDSKHSKSKVEINCKSGCPLSWRELNINPVFNRKIMSVFAFDSLDFVNQVGFLTSLLSDTERLASGRFFKPEDRNRYIVSKAVLRKLIGQYLGIQPSEIEFVESINKKPLVSGFDDLSYNISHSGTLTLIIIFQEDVGIDIEYTDRAIGYPEIMSGAFSETERLEVNKAGQPLRMFYRLWTRKEALIKGTGKGIDEDLPKIPSMDGTHEVNEALIGSSENWTITTYVLEDQYIFSLAQKSSSMDEPFFFHLKSSFFKE